MTDSCEAQQVILQENGIIRDKSGKFLGRMVEDIDAMCEEQYKRGRIHEREACAKLCDEKAKRDFNWASENADKYHAQASWAELCARAIRARSKHD